MKFVVAKKNTRFFRFQHFKPNFLVVIIEIEISWLNFWTEEEIVWYCWYIYIFLFCSASCDIDIRKHDYIVTFRVVFRGGRPTQSMSIEIFFFLYIYSWWWLPYPRGVHYCSWKKIATIWRFLAGLWKHTQTLQAYFRWFVKTWKRRCRGQLLMSFFLYKNILIGFFL